MLASLYGLGLLLGSYRRVYNCGVFSERSKTGQELRRKGAKGERSVRGESKKAFEIGLGA